MMMTKRSCLTLALAGLLAAPTLSTAQDFPNKPIRMVVAFSAGGPTDVLARVVAKGMSTALGQQVIIDNKAGAGGMIGTREVANAKADGYTILFGGDAALTVLPQMSKNAGYDGVKDFTPLRLVASQTNVLVAHKSVGVNDVAGLVAKAKAKPDAISFASAGVGTPAHLIGAMFESQAGVSLLHVPYKGAAPAMTDLIGGQINLMFVGMPVAQQNKTRPELVMLAVTGDKRSPAMPDVPTFAEAGIKGLGAESAIWWSVMGPPGLPADVRAKLDAALKTALSDPEVRNGLNLQGVEVLNLDAATTTQWIKRDHAKWGKLIQDKKISLD
ncbi:MAG: tripartite tricarboxylate transporter substrate binding protein [Burkholderiaceae bacterium]